MNHVNSTNLRSSHNKFSVFYANWPTAFTITMPTNRVPDDGHVLSETRLFSSEEMRRSGTVRASGNVSPGEADAAGTVRRLDADGGGPRKWSVVALSVLSSAVFVAAVGCFCALVYPIMKELRAERVRGVDGTEESILGFWSILVLSVLVGSICCMLSWTLSYLDSYQPGSPALSHRRDASDQGFLMDYGVAVLNGIMAVLTVIWSLT